jgi:hypothetical protein
LHNGRAGRRAQSVATATPSRSSGQNLAWVSERAPHQLSVAHRWSVRELRTRRGTGSRAVRNCGIHHRRPPEHCSTHKTASQRLQAACKPPTHESPPQVLRSGPPSIAIHRRLAWFFCPSAPSRGWLAFLPWSVASRSPSQAVRNSKKDPSDENRGQVKSSKSRGKLLLTGRPPLFAARLISARAPAGSLPWDSGCALRLCARSVCVATGVPSCPMRAQ